MVMVVGCGLRLVVGCGGGVGMGWDGCQSHPILWVCWLLWWWVGCWWLVVGGGFDGKIITCLCLFVWVGFLVFLFPCFLVCFLFFMGAFFGFLLRVSLLG